MRQEVKDEFNEIAYVGTFLFLMEAAAEMLGYPREERSFIVMVVLLFISCWIGPRMYKWVNQ